jgi:hypothetical protein
MGVLVAVYAGAQLVMAEPEAHRDPQAMQQFFAEYGVTTTHFSYRRCWRRLSLADPRNGTLLPYAQARVL